MLLLLLVTGLLTGLEVALVISLLLLLNSRIPIGILVLLKNVKLMLIAVRLIGDVLHLLLSTLVLISVELIPC